MPSPCERFILRIETIGRSKGSTAYHDHYNQYSEVISLASHGSVYGFPYADAVPGVTLNTVEYPGT
jgi:hypothetical protein